MNNLEDVFLKQPVSLSLENSICHIAKQGHDDNGN